MAGPPTDADGVVVPHDDDQTIPDNSLLVRYVPGQALIAMPNGLRRLSNGAFSRSSERIDRYRGMSVDMLDALKRDGVDPATRLRPEHEGAVVIRAGDLRALGLQVGPDHMGSGDKYHAAVWGLTNSGREAIRKRSTWLIRPAGTREAHEE